MAEILTGVACVLFFAAYVCLWLLVRQIGKAEKILRKYKADGTIDWSDDGR